MQREEQHELKSFILRILKQTRKWVSLFSELIFPLLRPINLHFR